MKYAVFTQDGLDQICDTYEDAKREAKDLRAMGCDTMICDAKDETLFDVADEVLREGGSLNKARKAMLRRAVENDAAR